MNFAEVKAITIPEGNVTKITDASGRVLWSAFIKFTMNGETYIADRGMTWAEWFASNYNTTGETEGTVTDANGNEVSMDAVIVGGTAYEVGFGPAMATITLPNGAVTRFGSGSRERTLSVRGDGITGDPSEVPVGTFITCMISGGDYDSAYIVLNGTTVASGEISNVKSVYYVYTVTGNATITLTQEGYSYYIRITEQ